MSTLPAWLHGLDQADWLYDGSPIRSKWQREAFDDLDWSRARMDMGPSIAGNLGPYWHVPRRTTDTIHRLYPKLLTTKWLPLLRRIAEEAQSDMLIVLQQITDVSGFGENDTEALAHAMNIAQAAISKVEHREALVMDITNADCCK